MQAMPPREDLGRDDRLRIEQQREELLRRGLAPATREFHQVVLAERAVAQDVDTEHTHGLGRCAGGTGKGVALDHGTDLADVPQPPQKAQPLLVHAARAHDLE